MVDRAEKETRDATNYKLTAHIIKGFTMKDVIGRQVRLCLYRMSGLQRKSDTFCVRLSLTQTQRISPPDDVILQIRYLRYLVSSSNNKTHFPMISLLAGGGCSFSEYS